MNRITSETQLVDMGFNESQAAYLYALQKSMEATDKLVITIGTRLAIDALAGMSKEVDVVAGRAREVSQRVSALERKASRPGTSEFEKLVASLFNPKQERVTKPHPEHAPYIAKRTPAEIAARLLEIGKEDVFGFMTADLVCYGFDLGLARKWVEEHPGHIRIKEEATEVEWESDRYSMEERITDYLPFAIEKATEHRGLSANRSLMHLRSWLFLDGQDDLLARVEKAPFKNYGAPALKMIAEHYHLPWPNDVAINNMAAGRPCRSGCDDGCATDNIENMARTDM